MSAFGQMGRALAWFERHLMAPLVCLAAAASLLADRALFVPWYVLGIYTIFVLTLASRLVRIGRRFTVARIDRPGKKEEFFHLELLLICAVFLLIHETGNQHSHLYAVLFALMASIGALEISLKRALLAALAAASLEGLLFWSNPASDIWLLLIHESSIWGFTILAALILRGLAFAMRQEQKVQMLHERQQTDQAAEEYRLSGGVLRSVTSDIPTETRLEHRRRSSVQRLNSGIGHLLMILNESLRPHTVGVFMLSTDEKTVRLKDAISDSDLLVREALPSGEGVIGAILKRRNAVSFDHVRPGYEGFNYYSAKETLKTFIGVPILEGEHARGVLVADRKVDVPFGDDDSSLLKITAGEILRTIETERILHDMDKEKNETDRFFQASDRLNRVVLLDEVIGEVLTSVRRIYSGTDFAAIVLREDDKNLVLAGIDADDEFEAWREKHLGSKIDARNSLCGLTFEKCAVLPQKPYHKMGREGRQVFGKSIHLSGLDSIKVFPLKVAGLDGHKNQAGEESVIGTLVVGGRGMDLFPEDHRKLLDRVNMLQTLANMAAISIQNAQRYQQLEKMATTDGLTGLHNHRRFQEMLSEAVTSSTRYDRPLSLILTDIDHFKRVNDTYGHPIGDQVLKRVSQVLAEHARAADKVCRYGGEEFSVILPETDLHGASMLAERFREEVGNIVHDCGLEKFQVTLSLGICTMPGKASGKQELVDRSDQALYHAKNSGRNRVVHFADIERKAATGA